LATSEECLPEHLGSLLAAELLIAAATTLAAAWAAETALGAGFREVARLAPAALGDNACAAADQPFHRATASGTRLDLRVGHLLALLKMASTGIALIFVSRHREPSFDSIGGYCNYTNWTISRAFPVINFVTPFASILKLRPALEAK